MKEWQNSLQHFTFLRDNLPQEPLALLSVKLCTGACGQGASKGKNSWAADRRELCDSGLSWTGHSCSRYPLVMRSVLKTEWAGKGRFMKTGLSLMHEKPEAISQRRDDKTEGIKPREGVRGALSLRGVTKGRQVNRFAFELSGSHIEAHQHLGISRGNLKCLRFHLNNFYFHFH